jgi:hypothetical protein
MKSLGTKFSSGIGGSKDAFHAPCVLVCSQQDLNPGQHVKFTDKSLANVLATVPGQAHAIVDPFLPGPVEAGEYFWALTLPGITQNLTHEFDVKLEKQAEEEAGPEPAKTIGSMFDTLEAELTMGLYGSKAAYEDGSECKNMGCG